MLYVRVKVAHVKVYGKGGGSANAGSGIGYRRIMIGNSRMFYRVFVLLRVRDFSGKIKMSYKD